MIASLGAAVLALLVAADSLRWRAEIVSEGRARNEPGPGEHAEVGEMELRARLGLVALDAPELAELTYAPRVLLQRTFFGSSLATGNATQQAGQLRLGARLAPTTVLSWYTTAEWGMVDYSPLSGAPIPGAVSLPSQRFVSTLALETMLDLSHRFSSRLRFSTRAGFRRSGGLGYDAVRVLPREMGPAAIARLEWDATRTSLLSVDADVAEHRFSARQFSALSSVLGAWTVHTSRQVVVEAAGGGAVFRSLDGRFTEYPAAVLGVAVENHPREDRVVRGSVRARLVPAINSFVEQVTETLRGEATAALSDGRFRILVEGSSGYAVRGADRGARDVRFGARSDWALTRTWSIEGGLRTAWTNQTVFRGWQSEAFIGLRFGDAGAL
jgi:hypothetical protein